MAEKSFITAEAEKMIQGLAVALRINLIEAARRKLDDYFDPKITRYAMDTSYDPESGKCGLTLKIHTSLDLKESMAVLERFEEDWLLDNLPADFDFVITVCQKDWIANE